VTIWHNTAPLTMRWQRAGRVPYRLRPYGLQASETGVQVVVAFEEAAPVTLLRLGRDLRRGVVVEGIVVDGGRSDLRRSQVSLRVGSAGRFLETIQGNHQAMAYGRWADVLVRLAPRLGIELDRV
jgi:hypothetical protein